MTKNLKYFIPRLFTSKDIVFCISAVFLLLMVASLGFAKLGFAYEKATDTKEQIRSMQEFVSNWNEQVSLVNQEPYRPVVEDQVDDVQSNILLLMASNQLNMTSFKAVSETQKDLSGHKFEIEVEGAWPSTVRLLENFHVKDALISIEAVKLVPTKNAGVKTSLEYKIYTKDMKAQANRANKS